MSKFTSPLDEVRVAAPCAADWEKMVGDDRARYCDSCSLHVYNLSGMTRREAEVLVTSTEGRLCVRFYRRADGTILTRNCPVGLSALRQRVSRWAGATLTAVLGFFAGLGLNFGVERTFAPEIMGESAVPAAAEAPAIMGGIAAVEAPPAEVKGRVVGVLTEVRGRMRPLTDAARTDAIAATGPAHTPRSKR
ncbi:MAG TPA: hypothetical protein VF508_12980 [Pyrinomonadaceae bacterium]